MSYGACLEAGFPQSTSPTQSSRLAGFQAQRVSITRGPCHIATFPSTAPAVWLPTCKWRLERYHQALLRDAVGPGRLRAGPCIHCCLWAELAEWPVLCVQILCSSLPSPWQKVMGSISLVPMSSHQSGYQEVSFPVS